MGSIGPLPIDPTTLALRVEDHLRSLFSIEFRSPGDGGRLMPARGEIAAVIMPHLLENVRAILVAVPTEDEPRVSPASLQREKDARADHAQAVRAIADMMRNAAGPA